MKPKEYVNKFNKFIKGSLRGSGLLPSVVMAQALYEAADENGMVGNSIHAKKYNNGVRILADKLWKGPKVRLPIRQIEVNKRPRKAWFRIYPNSELSINDRIKILRLKVPAWPTAFLHDDTVKMQTALVQLAGVSADPRYGDRIIRIIKKHRLYLMDSQWIIERVVRFVLNGAVFMALRYALQHWDQWVP